MEIPSVPTDSFYKFCAIAGTLIMLVSTYYTLQKKDMIDIKLLEAQSNINVSTNHHIKELESIKLLSLLKKNIKNRNTKLAYSKDDDGLYYSNEYIIKLKQEHDNILFNSRKRQIDSDLNYKLRDLYIKQTVYLLRVYYAVIAFGTILVFYGYRRWLRNQKQQDYLLELQIENQRLSIKL